MSGLFLDLSAAARKVGWMLEPVATPGPERAWRVGLVVVYGIDGGARAYSVENGDELTRLLQPGDGEGVVPLGERARELGRSLDVVAEVDPDPERDPERVSVRVWIEVSGGTAGDERYPVEGADDLARELAEKYRGEVGQSLPRWIKRAQ